MSLTGLMLSLAEDWLYLRVVSAAMHADLQNLDTRTMFAQVEQVGRVL